MLNFTKEDYMTYVNSGHISRKEHPEDSNVVILNYTDLCVYDKKWNHVTLACRGLILNEKTGEVLARPFQKFFNYGESLGNGVLAMPKTQEQPEITVKQDGSLGVMYRLNGRIRWATRGSFVSDQAKIAQEIWDEKYSHLIIPNNFTLMTEIIHPDTRVVVDYDGLKELVLIGIIDRFTGNDYEYAAMLGWSMNFKMPITKQIKNNLNTILELAKTLDHNEEGFVLRWEDGSRLKVKGDKYMEVHRIIHGMSLKQKVESWANGNLEEYIMKLPEEFRPEIEATASHCDELFGAVKYAIETHYKNAEKRGRKNFALWVQKWVAPELRGFMFMLYDGSEQVDDKIKEHIAKNYKNLFGVDK